MDKKSIVRKHNCLINAKYSYSLYEARLILHLLSLLRKDDEDFKLYRIPVSHFLDLSKFKDTKENKLNYLTETLGDLQSKKIIIPKESGFLQATWFASAEYMNDDDIVEIELSEKLKPYLLQLKECFTWYELENILELQSPYSFRLYEILKQYQTIGKREISLDELKFLLDLEEKYKLYADFKRRVLLQAQKEFLKHTDIIFDFKEKKVGRRVTTLIFFISKNIKVKKENGQHSQQLSAHQITALTERLNRRVRIEQQITENTFKKIIQKYPASHKDSKHIIENIVFKDPYSVFETLLAAFKGSYVVDDKKTREREKQRQEEALRQKEREEQQARFKELEREKAEEERLNAVFESLPAETKTLLLDKAKSLLAQNRPASLMRHYQKYPDMLHAEAMHYVREMLRHDAHKEEITV